MDQLNLGFKAFDLHELLCHFVARKAGLYKTCDMDIQLLDTTFVPQHELPQNLLQVACGSALLEWMNGASLKVIFVSTDQPLFWLYGREEIETVAQLEGASIAGFPGFAPPAALLRVALRSTGVAPDNIRVEAVRDDTARLGLLRSGDAAGAVISSAMPPAELEGMGFKPLLFFGDCMRVPTTGLAVSSELLESKPELIQKITSIFLASLRLIHTDEQLLKQVLLDCFQIEKACLDKTCHLIQNRFSKTGYTEPEVTNEAIALLAKDLRLKPDSMPGEPLYDFRFIKSIA